MPLWEVREQVERISRRIKRLDRDEEHSLSEISTRYYCIDPILRALGLDLDDPGHVRCEGSANWGRVDYELVVSGKSVALIEAKVLGALQSEAQYDAAEYQLRDCAGGQTFGARVLSDGDNWSIWDISSKLEDRQRFA